MTLRIVLALIACLPLAAAGQGRALQHDPFVRPALGPLPVPAAPGAAPRRVAAPEPMPKLSVHAVMVAGANSMANVDGVMVRLGDSFQGYRLIAVHDRSAVFEKNNAKFTLAVGKPSAKPGTGGTK